MMHTEKMTLKAFWEAVEQRLAAYSAELLFPLAHRKYHLIMPKKIIDDRIQKEYAQCQ